MKDWKKIVKTFAPSVATALGGPMAGVATKFVAGALLGNENATQSDLETAILSAKPDTLAKLRNIDADFKIEMKRLDVDLERMAVDDRGNARELAKQDMRPQIWLSTIFVGGYFALLWVLFSGAVVIDDSIRDMSNILLGVLSAGIPMILRFWFGGSPHDREHMDRIYNSTPHK